MDSILKFLQRRRSASGHTRGRYEGWNLTVATNSRAEDAEKDVVGPFLDRLVYSSNWR